MVVRLTALAIRYARVNLPQPLRQEGGGFEICALTTRTCSAAICCGFKSMPRFPVQSLIDMGDRICTTLMQLCLCHDWWRAATEL